MKGGITIGGTVDVASVGYINNDVNVRVVGTE